MADYKDRFIREQLYGKNLIQTHHVEPTVENLIQTHHVEPTVESRIDDMAYALFKEDLIDRDYADCLGVQPMFSDSHYEIRARMLVLLSPGAYEGPVRTPLDCYPTAKEVAVLEPLHTIFKK
jgi:hypothetical protein